MSDIRGKRKYAGAPVNELRKVDQDPMRLPPHKKPKVWKLTIEWVETRTIRRECEFTSRAARDESRRRIEREIAKKAQEKAEPRRYKPRWWDQRSAFAGYCEVEMDTLTEGPKYTEYYGEPLSPTTSDNV